jgi:hypothetical protein
LPEIPNVEPQVFDRQNACRSTGRAIAYNLDDLRCPRLLLALSVAVTMTSFGGTKGITNGITKTKNRQWIGLSKLWNLLPKRKLG